MIAKSTYISSSPLGLAMKSHVIPAVLDLMLSEHASRDLKLRDWHDVCPPSLAKLAKEDKCRQAVSVAWFGITYASVSWVEVTYIHELLRTLHADLHSKWTNWEESYSSEVADIFHEKLELMIKYEMIDSSEEALLKSIEHALYDIAKEGMPTGRYDRELVKRSWEILGKAVMPFATDDNLVQHPSTAPGVNGPGRIHRYAISSKWNPWKDWFIREDVTERYNPEDSSSVDPGTWVGAGHYQNDVIGHLLDELPDWHTMSLDTWCHIARFEVETDIKQRQELHDGPVLSDAIETETSI
ncbi:uncharacterized protein B0J16DRAFT_347136 [Fusarium flagelliforme]|nr:uncharacterized protein B0J16DRAFT_347136 [Fusarium flagelliforme]KAH7179529.1 hypothetical protein B0J16DRAFT_347136 [Fusarium flagelliforme]